MKIELKVPKYIKKIQEKLLENGYQCYFVGGSSSLCLNVVISTLSPLT